MAQKAAKATARRNAQVLQRTHLIALAVHGFYAVLRLLVFRRSLSKSSVVLYLLLSAPSVGIELFFERNSRPSYDGAELRRSGEDLEAKGLTEWMWDVLYWTWGCVVLAALAGDRAWYLYIAIPIYSAWLAYSTFGNVKQMLGGLGGAGADGPQGQGSVGAGPSSKRQQKMEKRGGQKTQYR